MSGAQEGPPLPMPAGEQHLASRLSMSQEDVQELSMFFAGPATPAQCENLLLWRRKGRQRVSALPELPEQPELRPQIEEVQPDPLDLYALSVGRTSGR